MKDSNIIEKVFLFSSKVPQLIIIGTVLIIIITFLLQVVQWTFPRIVQILKIKIINKTTDRLSKRLWLLREAAVTN